MGARAWGAVRSVSFIVEDAIMCGMLLDIGVSFFFFQAEDGIRDDLVTGVQTCALPISDPPRITAKGCCSRHARIVSNIRRAYSALTGSREDPKMDAYTPAANVVPSGLWVDTATIRVRSPMNRGNCSGQQTTTWSAPNSRASTASRTRRPPGGMPAPPSAVPGT